MAADALMDAQTKIEPIRLRWDDKTSRIVVTAKDETRYVLGVKEILYACRSRANETDFRQQLELLQDVLGRWVREHGDKIRNAYITLREGSILFLVVQKGKQHDGDFEDELSHLDIAVAQDGQMELLNVSMLILPNCSDAARAGFVDRNLFLAFGDS